jgi:endo-cleaving rubber dioxygenase
MEDLSRRRVLTLAGALGLVGAGMAASVADPAKAWAWSSKDSIAATSTTTDPFWVWDPAPDAVAASIVANGQQAAVNTAWQSWVNNGDPLPSGMPANLVSWLQQANQLPSWANTTLLAQAEKFNTRVSNYLFVLNSLGSGIESTVIPREARNVYYSAGGNDMKARAAKTFTFGYDLAAANAWGPTGHFIVTANKTRLVHSAVRSLLPQDPAWLAVTDEATPISNGDILRTFHSVGTFAYTKMVSWGIPISPTEAAAYLHSWQVALALLGVQEQFIPVSWAAAQAQAAQILTPVLAETPQGVSLAHTLLGYVETPLAGLDTGFINEFVRYLTSDQIGDWLGLTPRDYVSRALIDVGWPAFVLFDQGLSLFAPAGNDLFDQLLKGFAMLYLNNGTSATYTPITLPLTNRIGP